LHLLEDKAKAISTVHRVLKPGGYFVSSTACVAEMIPLFGFIAPLGKRLGLLPHIDVMRTPSSLQPSSGPDLPLSTSGGPNAWRLISSSPASAATSPVRTLCPTSARGFSESVPVCA